MKNIENKYIFLLDVDGTLSTGEYICDEKGKKSKVFGPDDTDALKLLKNICILNLFLGIRL